MNHRPYQFTEFGPEIEARAEELLERMALEEKVGQMTQANEGWVEDMATAVREGQVGSLLSITDVERINALQRVAVEESRLGIPLLIGNDVIHGYRTIFPIPLAESCTWNLELVQEGARVAAAEAAASGTDWIFAPMVDVCRDPRWGRIAEGAGEDPYLGSVMAEARVRGFQAAGLPGGRRIASCPKHYVAYGAAEAGKDYNTVDVSERTLRNVFLPPFEAAFEAGAGTVMSAFNEINGVPASANAFTLRTILREEWGWPGVILSDYDALGELIQHGFTEDLREAARRAALAGIDVDMMGNAFPRYLADLVRAGEVPEALLDEAVRRVLRLKLALGLFERPYTDPELAPAVLLSEEHRAAALEMARKSAVLLKNEGGTLPLDPEGQSIALIGPLAPDPDAALGCWRCEGRPEEAETLLGALRDLLPNEQALTYVEGCGVEGDELDLDGAVAAALAADVVVMALGESAEMSGEAHSRATLDLPGRQQELLEAVYATGKPVVVVLMSGRPLAVPWLAKHVPAILQAWHAGTEGGRAIAEILLGHVNPSGKTTVTFPRAEGQIPIYYYHKRTGRPVDHEGVIQFNVEHKSQYIDLHHTPLYPFGYGLSYTTFAYDDLRVETPEVPLDGALVVSVLVTNTGERAGDEVVQLYVRDRFGSITRPVKELKDFRRISLEPGEARKVRFEVPAARLGFYGLSMEYGVEPGEFELWVGPSSAEGLHGKFALVTEGA